jgi:hypothetical protein
MNRTVRDLLVAGAGLCTSAATALLIWLCLHFFGFAVYSLSYLFIPVGAIGCGIAAGSGYYFAARKLNHKATTLVMANLISMSISTYFVVQYIEYSYLEVKGQPVRNLVSFRTYLDIVIRNSTVGLLAGPQSSALGIFGYVLVLLPICGFALGGYFLFSKLQLRPYCDGCELYLEPDWIDSRYAYTDDEMKQLFVVLKKLCREENLAGAAGYFLKWGLDLPPRNCRLMAEISTSPCPKCGGQWLQFQGRMVVKDEYQRVGTWYAGGFSKTPLIVRQVRETAG